MRFIRRRLVPYPVHFGWDVLRLLFAPIPRTGPVKGGYSDLDLLQHQKGWEGRIILLDQGSPVVREDSLMVLSRRSQHLQQPFPVFWIRRKKARLIGPGLAHINDRKEISIESAGRAALKWDPSFNFFISGDPTRLEGPWTSVISRWMPVNRPVSYGHWVVDALPRLAVLNEFPAQTHILVPGPRARYQVESMEMLGLADRCRWTKEMYLEVEDYYFSSEPSAIVCYSPYTVQCLQKMFLPLIDRQKATPKRFFVRRAGPARNMTNEAEVLEFFEKAGWTVVDLADLSFADQVAWFAGAEAIAGIHGSGMNNTVWCPRGCKIIEFFGDTYLAGDAEWTAQCTGAEYHSLIFPGNHLLSATVDLNRVRATLQAAKLL